MQPNSQLKFWHIKKFNLLAGMTKEDMMKVAAMTRMTRHNRGDYLYLPGDSSDSIYFLKEGRVKILVMTEEGREVLLDIINPGEVFGEVDALQRTQHTETAQVFQDALLCEMDRKIFEDLLKTYPEMALRVYKRMGIRLRKIETRLVNLICKDIDTRVKEALVDLAGVEHKTEVPLPIKIKLTHQDIANLIGASRQETAKVLKRLEQDHIIELSYRSILVRSPDRLRASVATTGH